LLLVVWLAGTAVAGASEPPAVPAPATSASTAAVPGSPPGAVDRHCLRDTGSLIRARKGRCLPLAGRSYERAEVERTGAVDAADALERLDPAVRVSR